jgi:V/A-type H+/Na+-transporting ATPase subunit B
MINYKTISSIDGPLMFIRQTRNVSYGEMISFTDSAGKVLKGQVVGLENDVAIVQLFSTAGGFDLNEAGAKASGGSFMMNLSPSMIGRVFDGFNRPLDGISELNQVEGLSNLPFEKRDINGSAINPFRRSVPHSFIQTGISSIDVCNTVVKGQKIPIFSGNGLPDLQILSSIAKNAKTNNPQEKFVVVVAGIGITQPQYQYIYNEIKKSGALERSVFFMNTSSDSVVERLMVPRLALTASEYLAYDHDYSVLTLMFDMTNYANALREVSVAKKEIPGRSGYPGYLYTDLAGLYERAGTVHGKVGSITQIPILTMPNMDKTHVIPDLTGYITEGQVTLDNGLYQQGIYPCIDILSSLSRLKNNGQGEEHTREDHTQVSDQIFAAYAESLRQEELALVIGQDSLDETGQLYLQFIDLYRQDFLNQGDVNRSIGESLDVCWDILKILPRSELKKLKDPMIQKYKPEILNNI